MRSFHNFIWRWHSYAGILITPIMLVMALTGMVYLFQPQIEDVLYGDMWILDAPYRGKINHDALIADTLARFKTKHVQRYQPPHTPMQAAQLLLVTNNDEKITAIVHPHTHALRGVIKEKWRLTNLAREIHSGLMLGTIGKMLVETVACWVIVMVITGVYLWWIRHRHFLPRLRKTGRNAFREWHGIIGIWGGVWILMIVLTGLPWSVVWGGLLNYAGKITGEGFPQQIFAARPHSTSSHALQETSINRIIAAAHEIGMSDGFALEYPWGENGSYALMPLRHGHDHQGVHYAFLDRRNAKILLTISDAELGSIGRATSIGVRFHEGRLFGRANQLLNALAVTLLMLLGITGWIMWLKRKSKRAFSVPPTTFHTTHRMIFIAVLLMLCVALPLFGASIIVIYLYERIMRAF